MKRPGFRRRIVNGARATTRAANAARSAGRRCASGGDEGDRPALRSSTSTPPQPRPPGAARGRERAGVEAWPRPEVVVEPVPTQPAELAHGARCERVPGAALAPHALSRRSWLELMTRSRACTYDPRRARRSRRRASTAGSGSGAEVRAAGRADRSRELTTRVRDSVPRSSCRRDRGRALKIGALGRGSAIAFEHPCSPPGEQPVADQGHAALLPLG